MSDNKDYQAYLDGLENAWKVDGNKARIQPSDTVKAVKEDASELTLEQHQTAYLKALETAWQSVSYL